MSENIFMSPEFQAVFAQSVVAILTAIVGVLARGAFLFIKTNTTAQQFSILGEIADAAVNAAEQGAIAGFVSDKKATASNIVNQWLANSKIKGLTAEQIDAAIEAAVKLNFNADVQSPGSTSEGAVE